MSFITPSPVAGAHSSLLQLRTHSLLRPYQFRFADEEIEIKDSMWCHTVIKCELVVWRWQEEGSPVKSSSFWFWSSAPPPPPRHFTVTRAVSKWECQCWQKNRGSGGHQLLLPCSYPFTSCLVLIFMNYPLQTFWVIFDELSLWSLALLISATHSKEKCSYSKSSKKWVIKMQK